MSIIDITQPRHIPGAVLAKLPKTGHKIVDLASFGFVRDLSGADEHGYNQSSDVLLTQTVDGVDYNQMWAEFQATIRIQNAERQRLIDLISFTVTDPTESVTQLSGAKFERATEYGEPKGVRQKPTSWWLGYDFAFYDLAIRYTWQYLSTARAAQVESLHGSALEADNQLIFQKVMEALYNNFNRSADINDRPYTVYSLYNGADSVTPPTYKTNVFNNTHSHYLVSGAVAVDPGDLEAMQEHLRHHGYSKENGVVQVFGVNSVEGRVIRTFRAGVNGASYDFIPAVDEPGDRILDPGQYVSGDRPASTYRGMNVIGKYGDSLIIEDDLFPIGYVLLFGTGGAANLNNPVGIREHEQPNLRGLRLVQEAQREYPLIDSFYVRGVGTGIRQRGGAVVMQIKASGSYAPPTQYVFD